MRLRFSSGLIALGGVLLMGLLPVHAQGVQGAQGPKDAREIIKTAVQAELAADASDNSRWRYKDTQRELNDSVSIVVQTGHGSVKRLIARGGKPLTEAEARIEDARVQTFIHDPSQLVKQRKDGAQDDKSARELSTMLPDAFVWTVQSEDAEKITLHFSPNPKFDPQDMQSRVLGTMMGELVVDKAQHRIETISGRLTQDITIGWGLLGRLKAGGTFRVERRQIAPGLWQITETHVHIEGRVLFFKNIGQQQDEVQTEFTMVPPGTTLEQAAEMSKPGYVSGNVPANGTAK
jgi:hypothetical protein